MFNEKQSLQYQIEYYKDLLDEHDQSYQQIKRQLKEKSRVLIEDFIRGSFCFFVLGFGFTETVVN